MKRHFDSPKQAAAAVRRRDGPHSPPWPLRIHSDTLLRVHERLAGHSALALPAMPCGQLTGDLLRVIADKLGRGPSLVAWSSLNKTHMACLSEVRDLLWLHACTRERARTLQEGNLFHDNTAALLDQFLDQSRKPEGLFRSRALHGLDQRARTAMLLLHYAASYAFADFPQDRLQKHLSKAGAAGLEESLLWLDRISPEHDASDQWLPSAVKHWGKRLDLELQSFWHGWIRVLAPLAIGLPAEEEAAGARLLDTVLRLMLERPVWREAHITRRLNALEQAVMVAPATPEQALLRTGRIVFLRCRFDPGSIERACADRFLKALAQLEPSRRHACLGDLAQTGLDFHARLPENARPDRAGCEVARANLQLLIEHEEPLHHPSLTWVELLVIAARMHFPPSEAASYCARLLPILGHELHLLELHGSWLNEGEQTEQFHSLLAEAPQQWSAISERGGDLSTARALQSSHSEGVPALFGMRVQRLCSVLRRLCNVVHAAGRGAADAQGLALASQLQKLLGLWPVEAGRSILMGWLKA